MKKAISIMAVLMVLAAPAVMAQRVNEASLRSRIDKSESEIVDAKKSAKAATWINRAKAYSDAITEPTKNLFAGLDAPMLRIAMGEPDATEQTQDASVWVYPWVKVYIKENKVCAWAQTNEVVPDAFAKVHESYLKAYELDPNSASKIRSAIDVLINYYAQLGAVSIEIPDYKVSVDAYAKAAELQEIPVYDHVDPQYYFYAGQLAAFLGAEDASYFALGEGFLTKAQALGYTDDEGNLYYFLFHCYYGQREADRENIIKAKDTLLEGIGKYPKNERILDGLLQLYTAEDGVGDPADLVNLIDSALAETPDNADLWFGRGRVFFKLQNFDECIVSFKRLEELKPDDYDTEFYLGYFNIAKGDALTQEFNTKLDSYSTMEYNAEREKITETYMKAVPYLEKAMELRPDSVDCAQYLKELCFRLRAEDGMMDKYNKYNDIYKQLKGIE